MKKNMVCLAAIALLLLPAVPAAAAVGDSRAAIEARYGLPDLLEDGNKQFQTRNEWPAGGTAAAYGYAYPDDKRIASRWLSYDRQNRVETETVLLAQPLRVRAMADGFGREYDLAGAACELYLEPALRGEQLIAILRTATDEWVRLRFFLQADGTAVNMHSKLNGFEAQRITKEQYRQQRTKRNWRRVPNYFQPQLQFSEALTKRKQTDLIVVHHTAIEEMSVADIHQLHLSKGWAGIGYHKVILPDGRVEDGRPQEMVGAHALGVNRHSVGIVVVGNFEQRRPTEQQLHSLLQLTQQLMDAYHIPPQRVVPHRDATEGTSCPGAQFPWAEFQAQLKALPK